MSLTTRQARVFVVDDELIIASTLATILKRNGFDAVSFTHPMEALLAARLEAPDILISDIMMPGLTGIELAIRFKKYCPGCKTILFSGQASTADLLETARKQGHDFELLSKPIPPAEFVKKIKAMAMEIV